METLGPRFATFDELLCAPLEGLSFATDFVASGSCLGDDATLDFEEDCANCPNLFFEKKGDGFLSNKLFTSIDDATLTLPSENDSPNFPLSFRMDVNDVLCDFNAASFVGNMDAADLPVAASFATGHRFLWPPVQAQSRHSTLQ